MRIENDIKLDFDDVLIKPKRTALVSRADVDLIREYTFLNSKQRWSGCPIISANMDSCGVFSVARKLMKHDMLTALHKHYTIKELIDFFNEGNKNVWNRVFCSIGMSDDDLQKLRDISIDERMDEETGADWFPHMINIDIANGYSQNFVDRVKQVREVYPKAIILAGNVVTPNMVEELLLSGADIIKIGIGSGATCQTRIVAGVGYPQLSAVIECSDAAHGLGGHICSDGGCVYPGDIAKAMGAGADFCMVAGLFAGTDECEGEWEYADPTDKTSRKKYFLFHGMSSKEAQDKWNGGLSAHRASEGKEVKVPYKGSVDDIIQQIRGGLASACSYTGARRLKDLSKCTTFVRCNSTHNKVYGI
jgi:GMP reductase